MELNPSEVQRRVMADWITRSFPCCQPDGMEHVDIMISLANEQQS